MDNFYRIKFFLEMYIFKTDYFMDMPILNNSEIDKNV